MPSTVPPDILQVIQVSEQKAGEGKIIHLDNESVSNYPVLEEVLLNRDYYETDEPYQDGDLLIIGSVDFPEKIKQDTIDKYIFDNESGKRKYFEYAENYYRIGTIYAD
ncbi:hypothetical protein [Methanolacinia petrolearia]